MMRTGNPWIKNKEIKWQQKTAEIEKNYISKSCKRRERHFKSNWRVKKDNYRRVKTIMIEQFLKAKL